MVSVTLLLVFGVTSFGQVNDQEIIVAEFFDDVLRVGNGTVDNLFQIERSDNISHLTLADSSTAFVTNFTEIWKLDLAAGTVTTVVDLPTGYTSPSELTMSPDGDLVISTATHGIQRINPTNGVISDIYDATFFNPSDVVATGSGDLYVTEFFDGLGRVDSAGNWSKVGDFSTNFFSHIDIGPDGYLYAATTFEEGDVYRIHPGSGEHQRIADNVYTFIDDLQVGGDGFVYIAGDHDIDNDRLAEGTVLRLDPADGSWESVVDSERVGDPRPPFFNTRDIEIFFSDGGFHQAVHQTLPGDFDRSQVLDPEDIDRLTLAVLEGSLDSRFDLNEDGIVSDLDRHFWVKELKQTWIGDANLDGEFNSGDFVFVFRGGQYEDEVDGNSTWSTGDFNGDRDFDSGDFVAAFMDGGYERGPRAATAAVPEPSGARLMLLAALTMIRWRR